MQTPAIILLTAGVSTFLIGLSKGGLGGMAGPLITALMALVIPADQVLGLVLPLLIAGDVFAVSAHWKKWDRRLALLLIPGAIVGVTAATFFLTRVSAEVLQRALAIIILIFIVIKLVESGVSSPKFQQARGWFGTIAGAVAGFTSTLAHAGGPPITIYLLTQNLQPRRFVATSALFFMALNWIKVPYYLFAGLFDVNLIVRFIWLLPLLPAGVWAGKLLVQRVGKRPFEIAIYFLLLISAVLLLIR
jgi:uncharacterized membrane protein YfcA